MSFADEFKKHKDEMNSDRGEWFKFQEGQNKVRVLSEPVAFQEDFKNGICYTDCKFKGSMKYLAWILDHKDAKIKKMKIPYSVMEDIVNHMTSDDYSFSSFPMPYDLTVTALNAGTKEVKYTILPARSNTDIEQVVLDEFSKKKPVIEIIENMKDRNKKKHLEDGTWDRLHEIPGTKKLINDDFDTIEYPTGEVDPNDIPF